MAKRDPSKPRWKQDCKKCLWLGTLDHPAVSKHAPSCDVFICVKEPPCLVARYSHWEEDFHSQYSASAATDPKTVPELLVALERAVELGILTPTGELTSGSDCGV